MYSNQEPSKLPGIIPQPGADEIIKQCEFVIAESKKLIKNIEIVPLASVNRENVLMAWNRIDMFMEDIGGPAGLLSETSPDADVRKAADECELKISSFLTQIFQSKSLYERVKALKLKDPVDAEARKILLEAFEKRGVSLPEEKRVEAAKIFDTLDKLSQNFNRNLRDNNTVLAFGETELNGIPLVMLENREKTKEGAYIFSLDYPEYDAIMNYVENEQTRKTYYIAFKRRGGDENLKILAEIIKLRKQISALLGYKSYADWTLKYKMVERPNVVTSFLAKVKNKVEEVEKRELAELTAEKATYTSTSDPKFHRWDLPFYQHRIKKIRYSVDQETVRAQFPIEPTILWLMKITSVLYGLEFRANNELPVWHPDVRGFDVYDSAKKEYIASLYYDLFPRDGKYKHAAAFSVRRVSTAEKRTPVSTLVANFNRMGFSQDELETLFHEFGHIMHGILSKTRYLMHSGTSVKRDFVEAPSQMFEEWARRPEAYKLWKEVCRECKPIDFKLIERMNHARQFGQGIKYGRQRFYATWDMTLHTAHPDDPMKLWIAMESKTSLGHIKNTIMPASFGHIAGSYAAGYYVYMWSEVIALDMLSVFKGNIMDPKVGKRYRKIILENGGQVPPMELIKRFLGRKPSPESFFLEITGKRSNDNNGTQKPAAGSKKK